jgi:hypothetical protein
MMHVEVFLLIFFEKLEIVMQKKTSLGMIQSI